MAPFICHFGSEVLFILDFVTYLQALACFLPPTFIRKAVMRLPTGLLDRDGLAWAPRALCLFGTSKHGLASCCSANMNGITNKTTSKELPTRKTERKMRKSAEQ